MKSLSVRKVSVLGLVLMGASAVAAAVIPKDKDNSNLRAAGNLVQDSTSPNNQFTCKAVGSGNACDFTASNVVGATSFTTTDGEGNTTGTSFDAPGITTGINNTGLVVGSDQVRRSH